MRKLALFLAVVAFAACSKNNQANFSLDGYTLSINCNDSYHSGSDAVFTLFISPKMPEIQPENVELYLDNQPLSQDINAFSGPTTPNKFLFKRVFRVLNDTTSTGDHILYGIATFPNGASLESTKHFKFVVKPGIHYQNGIVIKISQDSIHGVIAADADIPTDDLTGDKVFAYGAYDGNYDAFSMDDGWANTNQFIGKPDANYAAIACLNFGIDGYAWYLPSYNELILCADNLPILRSSGLIYWSSTRNPDNLQQAYTYQSGARIGNPDQNLKESHDMQELYCVRPCRQF